MPTENLLIVNLTTTHSRLALCAMTLFSIVNQSTTPDKIIVWISNEPYLADKGINEIPKVLQDINKIKDIIEFKYTKNIGPYRKIIPALRVAKESDILVYADDDVIYHSEWLSTLFETFNRYEKKNIVAARVRLKKKNIFNFYKSYVAYPICTSEKTLCNDYIITGLGGAMLMRKHIEDKFITNNDFVDIAPKTDDLWISKIIILSKTMLTTSPKAISYFTEIEHSNNALSATNNPVLSGGFISVVIKKIKLKISSYFGLSDSNNDVAEKKIARYFNELH